MRDRQARQGAHTTRSLDAMPLHAHPTAVALQCAPPRWEKGGRLAPWVAAELELSLI